MEYSVKTAADVNVIGDIVPDEKKIRIPRQVCDITHVACDQIVHANDAVTFVEETVAEVRSDESGSARNQNSQCPLPLCVPEKTAKSVPVGGGLG
jgi:hypothetical protein